MHTDIEYTTGRCTVKPPKPSPDYPLFSHASGKWAKKINGTIRYFGSWKNTTPDDPDGIAGALEEYRQWVAARATTAAVTITVEYALNRFLSAKKSAAEGGLISTRTYLEHQRTCSRFANFVGKRRDVMSLTPDDFEGFRQARSKTLNLVSVGNEVTRVKTAFKWCHDHRIVPREIRFGAEFRKPGRRALRKHRREQGKKLFTPAQIHLLLDEAGLHLRAMVMLGINCAYGPHDCATLPLSSVDLDAGWADYPRPKTEVDRKCPLWPETVATLQASLQRRPVQRDGTYPRFFVQYGGQPFNNDTGDLSKYFTAVRRRVLADGGFYWLRHTFETIGGGAKDQVAVDAIMGHVDDSMASVYREEIADQRLLDVVGFVRSWLYAD